MVVTGIDQGLARGEGFILAGGQLAADHTGQVRVQSAHLADQLQALRITMAIDAAHHQQLCAVLLQCVEHHCNGGATAQVLDAHAVFGQPQLQVHQVPHVRIGFDGGNQAMRQALH
ncbi:hypothetical protein D3C72_1995450 [compost metagenome]